MNKTKIRRYYFYDIYQGGRYSLPKTLLIIILTLLVVLEADKFVQTLLEYGYCTQRGCYLDYIAYFFRGDYVYELSPSTSFVLPVYWLAFHALIAYIVGFYPYEDFVQYGRISVLYGKDKQSWWIAKVLWQIGMIVWCYVLVYVTIAGYIIVTHRMLSFDLTEEIWNNLSPELLGHNRIDLLIAFVALPILTSITITVIQSLAAFLTTPVIGFLVVNVLLVVSVYSTSYICIGNYTMWLRYAWATEQGIRPGFAILIDCSLIMISLVIGLRYFRNCDIIEKEMFF